MQDPNSHNSPFRTGYALTYDALTEMREHSHRFGHIDDSNAKLDEIAKLFATYVAFKRGQVSSFPETGSGTLIADLQSAFKEAAYLPQYCISQGASIFGPHPALSIRIGDEEMATSMINLVRGGIDFAFESQSEGLPFDIVSEAFGHFVRDNFRGNIEDAQYMTPPEVTNFVAELVLHELSERQDKSGVLGTDWTIVDPACGVGSFLSAVYQQAASYDRILPENLKLFGQDKIDRMVRLATINLELFGVSEYGITIGNSLEVNSPIDALNNKADVVCTNPPFAAKFSYEYIMTKCSSNFPLFSSLKHVNGLIDSELLFVERGLRLLKDGGYMLIVLPDGVISAKGLASVLRQHMANTIAIRAIIELPATTFAQAGTRVKTSILYVQKINSARRSRVFMSIANNIGFKVSSRKGVQIKTLHGRNDLDKILTIYRSFSDKRTSNNLEVLSLDPSCVAVPEEVLLKGSWTPKHYSATRLESVEKFRKNDEFDTIPLRDLVEFCTLTRKAVSWRSGYAFISVLHILNEGLINAGGILNYAPKTPGLPTYPGDILLSRINPRIPRVCVTPDFGVPTLCSSEFEIMIPRDGINPYMLAYILQTPGVQSQIHSFTSGTSSSHNRIRTSDLGQVLIPIPKFGTNKAETVNDLSNKYKNIMDALAQNTAALAKLRMQESEIFEL